MSRHEAAARGYRLLIAQEEREVRSRQWELTTGHRVERHTNCDRAHCPICEGGLTYCLRCGGLEGSLLPVCPGRQLTMDEHDANYKHYCAGTGPFASCHCETANAHGSCEHTS